jgi:hypothetical protein
MDYRKSFATEPGAKVRLGKIDPAFKDKHESHDTAAPEIQRHVERMGKLQYLLYADGNQSLLVVLQAARRRRQGWRGAPRLQRHESARDVGLRLQTTE